MEKLEGFGAEEEAKEEAKTVKKVESLEKVKARKRPYHYWEVAGESYKLKLTTAYIAKLKNKYKVNVLDLISSGDVPPLTVMLTIILAAGTPFNKGISKYDDVANLYDKWLDEGGNMMDLLQDVVIPTLAVSGFFTDKQAESIMKRLEEASEELL